MNAVRLSIGAVFAACVTFALLVMMYTLIETGDVNLDEEGPRKLDDIVMQDEDVDARTKEEKPDKPEKSEEPQQPDQPEPENVDLDARLDMGSLGTGRAQVNIDTGPGLGASDGEYLPMVKVAPIYPRRAQTMGIEGYCIVEYTVTRSGSVRDPVPVDCKPKGVFERASVKAALKFKYKPRVVSGEPVEVAGVQNRFLYRLEQ